MPPKVRTKRRLTPHQDRARASVDAILTAAEQVLREEGFARMTTNRIAARAGVNVALVYRYFAGKEAIVAALIERFTEAKRAGFERALQEHELSPLPVVIRALLEALVSIPDMPGLQRELFEQIDLTKRRAHIQAETAAMTHAMTALLARRSSELRALPDLAATLFVLEHATFAATHAASFYRPPTMGLDSVLDAL